MPKSRAPPWRRDSTQTASGKPGAVHWQSKQRLTAPPDTIIFTKPDASSAIPTQLATAPGQSPAPSADAGRPGARGTEPSCALAARLAPGPSWPSAAAPFAANRITLAPEAMGHLPRAIPGRFQELRINQPHQRQIERRFAPRSVVEPRPADRDPLPVPDHGPLGMRRRDHLPSPIQAHRAEALAKQSRSTTSWPICACRFSIAASDDCAVFLRCRPIRKHRRQPFSGPSLTIV
jgi:hypothetical protein